MATNTTKPAKATPVIDPGILAIREQAKAQVKALRLARKSAAVLKSIVDKKLPALTTEDRNKLSEALKVITTPALPGTETK